MPSTDDGYGNGVANVVSETSRSEILTVSNVDEMQWRLLRERLKTVYRQTEQQASATMPEGMLPDQNVEILLRLAGATLALLHWRSINDKGECRLSICGRARWRQSRQQRTCLVVSMIYFWMEQPLRIVKNESRRCSTD